MAKQTHHEAAPAIRRLALRRVWRFNAPLCPNSQGLQDRSVIVIP